jgi:hypothetical protein
MWRPYIHIWRFAMGRAVALRDDSDGPGLRGLAKASKDAGQSRRLLALAEIYDGGRRTAAARIGAVGLQVVRDWVLRFNARGPAGLIDGKAKPELDRKPSSRGAGRNGEPGPGRPRTNAPNRPGSSAPSVPPGASARPSSCHAATPRPCNGISMRSRPRYRPARTPF